MKCMHAVAVLASVVLPLFLSTFAARADEQCYGTVESYGGGTVVIRTTKHSTGHWKVNATTKVIGSIEPGDWVAADVEASGHVKSLRFEERPTAHGGVVKKVNGRVLSVKSGANIENWNLTETTIMSGVSEAEVTVGDELGVKLYKNHNLAEVRLIKRGVK